MPKLTWKFEAGGEKYHDQWTAVEVNALVRKNNDLEFVSYINGKFIGQFHSLPSAKGAVENSCE